WYVHPKTKVILREESIPQIIQSIKHILSFGFNERYCCHAGYVKNGGETFRHTLSYMEEMRGTAQTLRQNRYSIKDIQQPLFPKKYPITLFSFGEWHSKHIITSILENEKE